MLISPIIGEVIGMPNSDDPALTDDASIDGGGANKLEARRFNGAPVTTPSPIPLDIDTLVDATGVGVIAGGTGAGAGAGAGAGDPNS